MASLELDSTRMPTNAPASKSRAWKWVAIWFATLVPLAIAGLLLGLPSRSLESSANGNTLAFDAMMGLAIGAGLAYVTFAARSRALERGSMTTRGATAILFAGALVGTTLGAFLAWNTEIMANDKTLAFGQPENAGAAYAAGILLAAVSALLLAGALFRKRDRAGAFLAWTSGVAAAFGAAMLLSSLWVASNATRLHTLAMERKVVPDLAFWATIAAVGLVALARRRAR